MDSSSGTFSMAMSTIRSAMAAVVSTSVPTGLLMEIWSIPWSISGMRTILVDRQARIKTATSATEASIHTHRWRTK